MDPARRISQFILLTTNIIAKPTEGYNGNRGWWLIDQQPPLMVGGLRPHNPRTTDHESWVRVQRMFYPCLIPDSQNFGEFCNWSVSCVVLGF